MSMHAYKSWTGHGRVAMGELDSVFGSYGKLCAVPRQPGADFYEFVYGKVTLTANEGDAVTISSHPMPFLRASSWSTAWFTAYFGVKISTLHEWWNQEVIVSEISIEMGKCMWSNLADHHSFRNIKSVEVVDRLRQVGIQRVRLLTFDDPFLSDEDRMAYLGEVV